MNELQSQLEAKDRELQSVRTSVLVTSAAPQPASGATPATAPASAPVPATVRGSNTVEELNMLRNANAVRVIEARGKQYEP
jgi:hypothetical protein